MESIDKIKRLAEIVSKNTAPSSNTNTLIGNLLKAMALYMAEQHHGAVGGYQFLNSIDDLPTGDLTDKQKRTGYVVGENIYFYVGTDGDTLDGEYQNGGSFRGTRGDDGLSAYEIWKAIDPNNANKTEGEFLASLKQSGIGYDYAPTQSAATTDNTIYAIPDEEDENYWYEYYRKNGTLYFLGKHQGGLGGILGDLESLKQRDEPIVFTESKELNRCIKKLYVDISGFDGNYDGGGTGEILNLYIKYTYSSSKYIALYAANTGSNQVLFINLNGSGIYNAVYANGIYYYLEIDESALPQTTINQRVKLTSLATNIVNDNRVFDGGFTQASQINKYIKKLWIEFADDYILPSGYNSLDELKSDLRLYNISCLLSDDVYVPYIGFRLKSDYSTVFFSYTKNDGDFQEINYTKNGITLHALIDWEGLKGKEFTGKRMPLNPICFDGKFYHDAEILENINRIDVVVEDINAYFQGGNIMSTKRQSLEFTTGYIKTLLNEEIDYTRISTSNYASYYVTGLTSEDIGKTYIVTGKNGTSGKLVAKILNGIVIEIKNSIDNIITETVVVDGTFDALVFNVNANVEHSLVMKYQVEEDRKPLIEDFDSLKQMVEEMGGGSVATKRTIKTLHFGNSFTQDSFSYLPPILKEICPNLDFVIMIATIGACSLARHCANFTGTAQTVDGVTYDGSDNYSCAVFTSDNSSWEVKSLNVDAILNYADWDVITFQQYSVQSSMDWNFYFKPFIYKIHKSIYSKISNSQSILTKRVKLGWLLTHSRSQNSSESAVSPDFQRTKQIWNGIVLNSTKMSEETITEVIFPYGTAIQNLRTKTSLNALGDYNCAGLLQDGTHLQEGLPCLCAAYTNLLVIFKLAGIENVSIIGDKVGLNITDAWVTNINAPGTNGNVIGITPDNVYLAQVAAIAAVKNPFELSFDADGESEKGVTLDDYLL